MTVLTGAIIYTLAACASCWTTARGIKLGARERNPWLRGIMNRLGVVPALVSTNILGGCVFAALGVWQEDVGGWALVAVASVHVFLAWQNWKIVRRREALR